MPRWLWLRALGLIFLSAFWSLARQIEGLNGPNGILPAREHLPALRDAVGPWKALWYAPTVEWLGSSDRALMALVVVGALASILLVVNVAPRAAIAVALICFLSFVGGAQDFASYQSDGMLLEAGFASLFFAPPGLRPGLAPGWRSPRLAKFLLLWEWFRIYFESGVVKILSGDPQWRALTAMDHYYENGPLPTFLGWYVQQLSPHWVHAATVVLTFAVELGVVLLALGPRKARVACFAIVTPFQAAIILTANYAFLNYLVLCLGVLLLDDQKLNTGSGESPAQSPQKRNHFFSWARTAVLGWVLYGTIAAAPAISRALPHPLLLPAVALEPFRIANRYGLFAVMTEDRYEIEFQGSNDGSTWTPYPFRYKPQDPQKAPGIYAPYQPRFEWNLWFASLGEWRAYPWVVRAEMRLLEGKPEVLRLFADDPFHGKPPKLVRAVKWQYWFTTPAEKRRTGAWWRRELLGLYAPELEDRGGEIKAVELP